MKQKLLLSAASAALAALVMQAALPKEASPFGYGGSMRTRTAASASKAPAKTPQKMKISAFIGDGLSEVEKYGDLQLIEGEDFSLLSTGSEENPDLDTNLEYGLNDKEWEYPWNNMRKEFIHSNLRWGIGGAASAGGCVYFTLSKENEGSSQLVTPVLDLTKNGGAFVVEFRARLLHDDPEVEGEYQPTFLGIEAMETNDWGPSWNDVDGKVTIPALKDEKLNLTTEWQTYRFLFQGGGPSTLVHFVGSAIRDRASAYEQGIFMDDVKVYSLVPKVATPVLKRHSDFTDDSFTLNWDAVGGADSYIVNCWSTDVYGTTTYLAKDKEVTDTKLALTGADSLEEYFFTVQAKKGENVSIVPLPGSVFDITAPELGTVEQLDDRGHQWETHVQPNDAAFGYNLWAMGKREAKADGEFTLTDFDFTGWVEESWYKGEVYTRENPFDGGVIGGPYFPTKLAQQGWYGENFHEYEGSLVLIPFFPTSDPYHEQTCFVSPEFDLSRDGGKAKLNLRACTDLWTEVDPAVYGYIAVAVFNWNPEVNDYSQAGDPVYVKTLNADWQDFNLTLEGCSDRCKIGIFGFGSFEDIYISRLKLTQNYKAGESFYDPFYFRTWQLAESEDVTDPASFSFNVPFRFMDGDIYQKAQAARAHYDAQGSYDGYVLSPMTETGKVGHAQPSGVSLVESDLAGKVTVVGGVVMISNPDHEQITISRADGAVEAYGTSEAFSFRPGVGGIYVIRLGNRSLKLAL